MFQFRIFLLIGLMLMNVSTVKAELSILPFTKGSFSEIKKQLENKPFIVIFWSESCSYCMKELAMFGRLYKQYPQIELVTVATDSFLDDEIVKRVLKRSKLDLKKTWVFAERFQEKVYFDVNKRWRGELPVTHFFDRKNKELRHLGVVKEDELVEWLNTQSIGPIKKD